MKTWQCIVCGYIYDETQGDPEHGVAPGTRFNVMYSPRQIFECSGPLFRNGFE